VVDIIILQATAVDFEGWVNCWRCWCHCKKLTRMEKEDEIAERTGQLIQI